MSGQIDLDERILARLKAVRDAYLDVTHQTKCLKELHEVLQSEDKDLMMRRDQRSSNLRALKLRELKAILRKQYRDNFPLPSLDTSLVLVHFDDMKRPFFEFRHKPDFWPKGYPYFAGEKPDEIIILYSRAIYVKVLRAFEKEPPHQTREGEMSSTEDRNANSAHAEVPVQVNIKTEEDTEELIDLEPAHEPEDEQENPEEEELGEGGPEEVAMPENQVADNQPEEEVEDGENSAWQPQPVSPNNNANKVPNRATANNNNNSNDLHHQVPIKMEAPAAKHEIRIIRKRPAPEYNSASSSLQAPPLPPPNYPKRKYTSGTPSPTAAVPRNSSSSSFSQTRAASSTPFESTTSGTSQSAALSPTTIAMNFLASPAFLAAKENTYFFCPLCPKKFEKVLLKDHVNIWHLGKKKHRCTWPGCDYTTQWLIEAKSHVRTDHKADSKKFVDQYQVSTSSSSASSSSTLTISNLNRQSHAPTGIAATVELFLSSSAYMEAKGSHRLICPVCFKDIEKRQIKDHMIAIHLSYKQYHCSFNGCQYATGYRSNVTGHMKKAHPQAVGNPEQYIKILPFSSY